MATAKKEPEMEFVPEVKMRTIKIPLTKDQQDDVFVRVNQETFLIKRGEYVTVPEYVVEVLDNAEKATLEGIRFREAHTSKS